MTQHYIIAVEIPTRRDAGEEGNATQGFPLWFDDLFSRSSVYLSELHLFAPEMYSKYVDVIKLDQIYFPSRSGTAIETFGAIIVPALCLL
jgi:hypothetical protein